MKIPDTIRKEWPAILVTLFFAIVVITIAVILSKATLTDRESTLLTVLLTLFSVLASFVIARIYSRFTYSENLRDMGVQIARGIIVLERQTEILLSWVSGKRSTLDATSSPEVVDAALEHIQETLSSFLDMNDAALSGIAGVIGDALAQYEGVMEHISEIRNQASEQTQKVEAELAVARSHDEIKRLTKLIDEISVDANKRISVLARSSSLPIPEKPARSMFFASCPNCGNETLEEMVDRQGETKVLQCENCEEHFNAHVTASPNLLTRPRGGFRASSLRKADGVSERVHNYLRSKGRYVDPDIVQSICDLTVESVGQVSENGAEITPYAVQQNAIAVNNSRDNLISNTGIRRFFTFLVFGKFFEFEGNASTEFKAPFDNELDIEALQLGYLLVVVNQLRTHIELSVEDVPLITAALIGRTDLGVDEVADLIQQGTESPEGLEDAPKS